MSLKYTLACFDLVDQILNRPRSCDRQHCDDPVAGEDRKGVEVCQHHAEEDWARD